MRRPWLLNLLLVAALAVAALRLSRFLQEPLPPLPAPPAAADEAAAPGAPAAGAPGSPGEPDPGAGSGEGAAGFDAIVARDLFSPTRGVVPPKPPSAEARTAPKPLPQPKLTLFGVVIVEGERSAYLQEGAGDAKPRKVREGETIAGATLKTIRPDGVTLSWAGGDMTVALRTPKEGVASGPQAPAGGGTAAVPQQGQTPAAFPRRFPQQGGAAPAVAQPGMPVPGVPRLIPPPVEEEDEGDEEAVPEDDEELLEDDSGDGAEEE